LDEISRLIISKGRQSVKEYKLEGRRIIIGRSTGDKSRGPDIDLTPDKSVSLEHACLYSEKDEWFIRDMGSTNGTLVGEKDIGMHGESVKVSTDVPIKIGETILMPTPANRHRATWEGLTLGFDFPPAINYALNHCGTPVLTNITVLNIGEKRSKEFSLTFSVPEYSHDVVIRIPPIDPCKIFEANNPAFTFKQERLELLTDRVITRLEVKTKERLLFKKNIWALGFYEWPYEPNFSRTLACFVQPGNPVVRNITSGAESFLEKITGTASFSDFEYIQHSASVNTILEALYNCIKDRYQIKYADPPISYELRSQVIRPPHEVVFDNETRKGIGTCVDLAILMASCLESLKLKPIIIVIKKNDWEQHAMAGCWETNAVNATPYLDSATVSAALAEGRIHLIECTGFSVNPDKSLSYDEAKKSAEDQFKMGKFLYVLDIFSLRNAPVGKITPIGFNADAETVRILRKCESFARKQGSMQINTSHLLYGFLTAGGEISRQIFKEVGVDINKAKEFVAKDVKGSFYGKPEESLNYGRVLDQSKNLASINHSSVEKVYHLWWSFLHLDSRHLDQVLESIDTNVIELLEKLNKALKSKGIEIKKPKDSFVGVKPRY
jgi:hypothetical protein